jgi:hypothetical protein
MSNLRLTIGSSFDDEEVVLEPNTIEPAIDEGATPARSAGAPMAVVPQRPFTCYLFFAVFAGLL